MINNDVTNEFSINLLTDTDTSAYILRIRETLPSSPYRDDPPHCTLLRGVTTPRTMSDDELRSFVAPLLMHDTCSLDMQLDEVAEKSNQFYQPTTLLVLMSTPEILAYRTKIADALQEKGCIIEPQERSHYLPHVSIRLGVTVDQQQKSAINAHYANTPISFSRYAIFRLKLVGNTRHMHIVEI